MILLINYISRNQKRKAVGLMKVFFYWQVYFFRRFVIKKQVKKKAVSFHSMLEVFPNFKSKDSFYLQNLIRLLRLLDLVSRLDKRLDLTYFWNITTYQVFERIRLVLGHPKT